jgi:hypothetical protein
MFQDVRSELFPEFSLLLKSETLYNHSLGDFVDITLHWEHNMTQQSECNEKLLCALHCR